MRVPNLISANKFWDDFAHHILKEGKPQGFVSENFIYATNSTTELIMMLAVIDLPFDEPTHRIGIEGNKGIKVDTAGNMAVFKKEIKEAEADLDTNLLSIHRFYEYSNPNSKKKLKEFLTHQVYTWEVVVTNVSTDQQNFQTLWQIPEGSIPVSNTNYQKTETKQLGPYSTLTFKFHFYFPRTGKFMQFPTNITMNEKVVATAKTCYFNVVDELSEITFEMFSDYIQSGNFDKICEFLQTANLIEREKGFAFYDILWLLKDKDKFYRVYEILRSRFIYDNDVWSYGFNYSDTEVMNEYMQRNVINVSNNNTYFYQDLNRPSGELISKCTYDDLLTLCLGFRHLDYYPLINARAHQLADEENQGILNREFRETYNRFLFDLAGKKALDTEDKLNWTLYYLLQDKTIEAIDIFAQVDASTIEDQGSMRVQFDYLAAYLDFFTGIETNFKTAREVSAKYAEYPVLYWKGLFTEIAEQLQEYDGDLNLGDKVDQANELLKKDNLKVSKNLEPLIECRLDRKDIVIDYLNIDKLDVKYYVIDPELMFSKSPFISQNTDEFSYIKPLKVSVVELSKDLKSKTVAIDPEFVTKNLIIELVGGGKQVFLSYFSTDMRVIVNENFGELKVIDEKGNSQPKVYVKVYAKHNNGEVKFFRDGYTDIRGKIEYAQSSSGKLGTIEKFSVFIMSDELGSMTKECKPPSNVKKDRY